MTQTICASKGPIYAKITIPGSKSISLRALMLSALADGVSEISGLRINEDTQAFIHALHKLGIVSQLDEKNHSCIVAGGNGLFPKSQATVWCANSISTARFLLAACASTKGVYYFDGDSHLRTRRMAYLLSALMRQGTQIIPNDTAHMPFTLVGSDSLEGGEIILDGHMTSQLISALMIVSPYARSPFTFTVSDLSNQPFIDMTCALMAEYGVLVHRIHKGQFMIPVPQRYQAKDYTVEPDYSLAAYYFAAAAVTGGEVTIQPTKCRLSKQPNAKILSVLEKMGCQIIESHSGLKLKANVNLQGIEVSMKDFSDAFFALVAIAPFAKSPIRISHIGEIQKKESESLIAIKSEFTKLDIRVETGEDWIKIHPSTPKGTQVHSHHHPKLTMALAVIGLAVPGVTIDDVACVEKTYPDFFKSWQKLTIKSNINSISS